MKNAKTSVKIIKCNSGARDIVESLQKLSKDQKEISAIPVVKRLNMETAREK